MPPIPAVVNKVLHLTSNLQTNLDQIAETISADPSLTAKVLKVSNAAYYRRSRQVKTVVEAIQTIGFDSVRSIVTASSLHSFFERVSIEQIVRDLWHHSLCTAVASRAIARHFGESDPEEAFVAGLLHDLGKLVLYKISPNLFGKIVDEVKEKSLPFTKVEYDVLGCDHSDIGELLLSKWSFPRGLIGRVARHHSPYGSTDQTGLAPYFVINIANNLSRKLGAGFYGPFDNNVHAIFCGPDGMVSESDYSGLYGSIEEEYSLQLTTFEE